MSNENVESFIGEFAKSLNEETFVKMTLGHYKGENGHLQKILVRIAKTKKGTRLFFLYRYDTRDVARNFSFPDGTSKLCEIIGTDFFSGHLFTTKNDFQLDIGKKQKSRLNKSKPTFQSTPSLEHDRGKKFQIDPDSFYLRALGITTDAGEIRLRQQDKWRQINKFVETLASLFDKSPLAGRTALNIVDMGSGKGYLTFATYHYFRNMRNIDVTITGVEARMELVGLCNDIAKFSEFKNLRFVQGMIGDSKLENVDIMIALHACDTATDDAIFQGIAGGVDLILTAPCCHKEIRPQITPPEMFSGILRHGIMLERIAETFTDGLRALLLEKSGYSTRVFEFISTEHTPKNNMIVGTRLERRTNGETISNQIDQIKKFYGIRSQRLDELLKSGNTE